MLLHGHQGRLIGQVHLFRFSSVESVNELSSTKLGTPIDFLKWHKSDISHRYSID